MLKRITSNGVQLVTDSAGNGNSILYITGTAGDLRKSSSPLHSPLISKFRVISYDQRGMGQSDKPNVPYSMLDYAQDAIAVLDAFDIQRVRLAGYSFGGMVAQEVAIRWPERVSQLALMATTAGGDGGKSYPIEQFEHLTPLDSAKQRLEIIDLSFTTQWQIANPEEASLRIKARAKAESMYAREPGHSVGRKRQLAARAEHNTYDRLNTISAPTLVIAGDRDGQAPKRSQEAMAARIPNCRFETISGSHQMAQENEDMYRLVSDFFESDD